MKRDSLSWPLRGSLGAIGVTVMTATPAHAEMPPAIEAMVREAARNGDKATLDAVVKIARATNVADSDAIGILASTLWAETEQKQKEERQQQLASMRFFQGWTGQGQMGFGLTSGNTTESSAVFGVSLDRQNLRTRHKMSALVDYLRTNGITARQRYAFDYAINYTVSDGLYLVGTLGWERDRFAGYARRFTESIGIGYRALATDTMTLDIEGGPAFRQALYTDAQLVGLETNGQLNEVGARGSLAYKWNISDVTNFTQNASIVNGENNTTIISTTALTTKLIGKLSTRLSFNLQNESNPLENRRPTDTTTRATLVYSF
jgi:putative salt-induced outer membrane protein